MSRYAAVHDWDVLGGVGDARPTAEQIIQDTGVENTLASKVILITGVTSGIGAASAIALAKTGATLVCAGRSIPRAKAALAAIADYPHLHFLELDLTSRASIAKSAAEFLRQFRGQLNILINNAGGILARHSLTDDGFERTAAMNYLGQFELFALLKDTLLSSASAAFPSRVINVSSTGHKLAQIGSLDIVKVKEQDYDPSASYCQAKVATVYMASEIESRYGARNLHAWSVHPGAMLESSFLDSSGFDEATIKHLTQGFPAPYFKSNEQGAATQVWAAVSAEVLEKGALGRYLEDVAVAVPEADTKFPSILGYAKHTYDEEKATTLWEATEKVLDVKV